MDRIFAFLELFSEAFYGNCICPVDGLESYITDRLDYIDSLAFSWD